LIRNVVVRIPSRIPPHGRRIDCDGRGVERGMALRNRRRTATVEAGCKIVISVRDRYNVYTFSAVYPLYKRRNRKKDHAELPA
jgi:hypothetical protein